MGKLNLLGIFFAISSSVSGLEAFSNFGPVNKAGDLRLAPENLSLGNSQFSRTDFYNLYDLNGSSLGLFERLDNQFLVHFNGLVSSNQDEDDALSWKSTAIDVPVVGINYSNKLAALFYYSNYSDEYKPARQELVQSGFHRIGLDVAGRSSSGLFQAGISAHGSLGELDYGGGTKRVWFDVEDLRIDAGSKIYQGVILSGYTGISMHFDSLRSDNKLERTARFALPYFGFLTDVETGGDHPVFAQGLVEFKTERFWGEYNAGGGGNEYDIIWDKSMLVEGNVLYRNTQIENFGLVPAFSFGYTKEKMQVYDGLSGNQNPFHHGDRKQQKDWTQSGLDIGAGLTVNHREMNSVLIEGETSGLTLNRDTTIKERYFRYSLGLESNLHLLKGLGLPDGMELSIRAGYSWQQTSPSNPGFHAYQFEDWVANSQVPSRLHVTAPLALQKQVQRGIHMGAGWAVQNGKFKTDLLLSFLSGDSQYLSGEDFPWTGFEVGFSGTLQIF